MAVPMVVVVRLGLWKVKRLSSKSLSPAKINSVLILLWNIILKADCSIPIKHQCDNSYDTWYTTYAQRSSCRTGAWPARKSSGKFSRPGVSISKVTKACILDISAGVPKPFQYLFESIIYRQDRLSCGRSTAMQWYIFLHQDHDRLQSSLARVSDLSADTLLLLPLYQLLIYGACGHFRYVVSAAWNILPLRETWLPWLWDRRRVCYKGPLDRLCSVGSWLPSL